MTKIGQAMIDLIWSLKDPTLLDKKPKLKIRSNHKKVKRDETPKGRTWASRSLGTAYAYKGWYVTGDTLDLIRKQAKKEGEKLVGIYAD